MKHLIPASFAFAGAYLIGLPLQSQLAASAIITSLVNRSMEGANSNMYPSGAPLLHVFLPWIAGAILIGFAIYLALKSHRAGQGL